MKDPYFSGISGIAPILNFQIPETQSMSEYAIKRGLTSPEIVSFLKKASLSRDTYKLQLEELGKKYIALDLKYNDVCQKNDQLLAQKTDENNSLVRIIKQNEQKVSSIQCQNNVLRLTLKNIAPLLKDNTQAYGIIQFALLKTTE